MLGLRDSVILWGSIATMDTTTMLRCVLLAPWMSVVSFRLFILRLMMLISTMGTTVRTSVWASIGVMRYMSAGSCF